MHTEKKKSRSIKDFIYYWFFRYMLVTELYMVEKWERVVIHIIFFIIFTVISLFNSRVILTLVSWATESMFNNYYHLNSTSSVHVETSSVEL